MIYTVTTQQGPNGHLIGHYNNSDKTIAVHSNMINAAIMSFLRRNGIPIAFIEKISDNKFLTENCQVLPLDFELHQNPLQTLTNKSPNAIHGISASHHWKGPWIETYLRTSDGKVIFNGETLVEGIDSVKGQESPVVSDHTSKIWKIIDPIKRTSLDKTIQISLILGENHLEQTDCINKIVQKVFSLLERKWKESGYRMTMLRMNVGIASDGSIKVVNVIDHSSWQLITGDKSELSTSTENHALVAQLVSNF